MTRSMSRLTRALVIATVALISISGIALAQDGGVVQEPTVTALATAAGLSGVIFVIMSVLRTVIPAATFDVWGAALAVVIGILLALAYALTRPTGITADTILQALLVGLFAGGFSQNVNTIVARPLEARKNL